MSMIKDRCFEAERSGIAAEAQCLQNVAI